MREREPEKEQERVASGEKARSGRGASDPASGAYREKPRGFKVFYTGREKHRERDRDTERDESVPG